MQSLIVVAMLVVGSVSAAHAGGRFEVDRMRVELSERNPTAAIVLRNVGTSVLRVELDARSWRDDERGTMQLAAAPGLVVRPSLVELAPGASRPIRIGTTARAGVAEGSYRLFVKELPDRHVVPGSRIQVLTQISLPIFIAPVRPTRAAVVSVARAGKTAEVAIAARGSMHLKLATVRVRGLAGEREVWREEAIGWYVLPGAVRRFAIELRQAGCAGADRLIAEAIDETGSVWSTRAVSCTD